MKLMMYCKFWIFAHKWHQQAPYRINNLHFKYDDYIEKFIFKIISEFFNFNVMKGTNFIANISNES